MLEATPEKNATANTKYVDRRPQIFHTGQLLDVDDISIADDSSWRDLDAADCELIEADLRDAKYGQTQLAPPSIVTVGRAEQVASDGLLRLNNGKKMIFVMQKLKKEHKNRLARRTSHKEEEMEVDDAISPRPREWDSSSPR